MSMTAPQIIVDPLHALVAGGFISGTKRPIPLVATRFNVDLNHGLATVSATRIFKNAEETSIEATITFPVPRGTFQPDGADRGTCSQGSRPTQEPSPRRL